jgi:hypothetical protein
MPSFKPPIPTFRLSLFFALVFLASALQSQSLKVLFLGNSYTNANNLPSLIASLASAAGDTLQWDWNTPGGYTYQLHSNDPASINKIKADKWDYVVLQEQSQLPSFPPSQVQSDVYPYAAVLDSMIRDNWACAEPVFFMTWGRKYGDQANCMNYPPICTFLGMNGRLRQSYEEMSVLNSATMAPVGMAWQHSWLADSTIDLWSGDNSHPSLQGSYLSACVFYGLLFQKSPTSNSFMAGLPAQEAQFLQQIAHNTLFDSLSLWTSHGDIPHASFSYQANLLNVYFNDQSLNAQSWVWDFGDGNQSVVSSPSHVYSAAGQYIVSLDVYSNCRSQMYTDTIILSSGASLSELPQRLIHIYPNPSTGKVYIELEEDMETFEVLNLSGEKLFSGQAPNEVIDLSALPVGVYLLKAMSGQGIVSHSRIMIVR